MVGTVLSLVAVVFLVLLNGFFVAAEFALVSVRKSRIDQLAQEGVGRARLVQKAIHQLDTYIAATQLGITMASLALGFIGEPAIVKLIEPLFHDLLPEAGAFFTAHTVAFIIAFSIATALHIVFGELAPKSIALQRAEQTSLWVTRPLDLFLKTFRPFIVALNAVGNGVVRLIGLEPVGGHGSVHSVEEIQLLVRSSRAAGLLDEGQERMVAGVFAFSDKTAGQAMTPRTRIDALPLTVGLHELARHLAGGTHSRVPIYDGDVDHVVGVVHAKDVLRLLEDGTQPAGFDVRPIMRPVAFVPQSVSLDTLMDRMKRQKAHLAIVIDEFGGTAGLVTLEDVLEEIVGDVSDEFDPAEQQIEHRPDGSVAFDGMLPIGEVNSRFALALSDDDYDTVGGYVFGELQRQPVVGDTLTLDDGRLLRVIEVDERRIARLLLVPEPGQRRAAPRPANSVASDPAVPPPSTP